MNYPLIANAVMKVDEFLVALDASIEAITDIRAGDTVRGSDHLEVGEIKEVVASTEQSDGYLLVARGILRMDTCIPLDAVVKRAGRAVFINLPKIVVGKMPWGKPPALVEQQAKRGPRAAGVGNLYRSRSPSVHSQPAGGS